MKNRVFICSLISLSTVAVFRVVGEEEAGTTLPVKLQPTPPETPNRFGLSYRMGFNIATDFKNFGRFGNPNPRRNLDGDRYNYDNGYVYPDAGTPNSGLTHYWGYDDFTYQGTGQLPGNGTLLMQRASSAGIDSSDRGDDFQSGLELTYNRELGRNEKLRWGLEAALNFMSLDVNDNQPLAGNANLRSDAYALQVPENLMPPGGHQGRKNGPGVVIGADPQTSRSSLPESVTGSRDFDADIFGFRLGPYLEIPLGKKCSLAFSGGLALAEINSDFRFIEKIQAGSVMFPATQGSGSHSDWLAGGYVSGTVSYAMTRSANLVGGVQFQDLGDYSHQLNGKSAVLNLSKSLFVTLGLSYSF